MVEVLAEPEKLHGTCPECKSLLSYDFGDIKKQHIKDYGHGSETICTVTCPVKGCRGQIWWSE